MTFQKSVQVFILIHTLAKQRAAQISISVTKIKKNVSPSRTTKMNWLITDSEHVTRNFPRTQIRADTNMSFFYKLIATWLSLSCRQIILWIHPTTGAGARFQRWTMNAKPRQRPQPRSETITHHQMIVNQSRLRLVGVFLCCVAYFISESSCCHCSFKAKDCKINSHLNFNIYQIGRSLWWLVSKI